MKKFLSIFTALLVLLALNPAYAADIDNYNADFHIVKDKTVVSITIDFPIKTSDTYKFQLPEDHTALSAYIDNQSITPDISNNILSFDLNKNSKINFNYVTEEFIDKSNFLLNMDYNNNINNLQIKIILPERATLKKPITQGDISSGSIYPKPSQATTDGRSLIFIWKRKNITPEDEISIFAQIQPKANYTPLAIIIIAIIIILSGTIILFSKKKKTSSQKEKIKIKKEDHVEKHLKPDEEQIINVLKLKKGSCEQGTLRIATDFSKAKLSRLLKELEERKVIKKEKRGKKNLVFLKK